VGTFERTFSSDDESEREVWRVYQGRESWPYRENRFSVTEPERGTEHLARPTSRQRLRAGSTAFHSPAVLDTLESWADGLCGLFEATGAADPPLWGPRTAAETKAAAARSDGQSSAVTASCSSSW
jgi:hypothetical protein